jgi:leucyl aminopeptidase
MKITVVIQSITDFAGDVLIVNLFQNVKSPSGATGAVDRALGGMITKLIADHEIKGKLGEVTVLHDCKKLKAQKVIIVGLGKQKALSLDNIRKAAAVAAKKAKEISAKTVGTVVHGAGIGGTNPRRAAQTIVEGTCLALYSFTEYKKPEDSHQIRAFSLVEQDKSKSKELNEGARVGKILADSQNIARDLINEPANNLTPAKLLKRIQKILKDSGMTRTVQCQCLDKKMLQQLGMGALLSVAQGSIHEPKFIVLRVKKTHQPLVCLIGKTVTFDSGGISLKPSSGMGSMKGDMAGGAVAIGTTIALAKSNSKVNLMTLIPAVENMPSGSAYRPGDVVKAMNGKTVEIVSTDAEGRLTLADAIVYAEKNGAQVVIDIATLTGGCVVALGTRIAGLMGNKQQLIKQLIKVTENTGEQFWQLPLYDEYKKLIDSDVADVKNSGGRAASTITAGLFLQQFVNKTKWLHIDVAGNELTDRKSYYTPVGGTGFGVRTLYEFLSNLE